MTWMLMPSIIERQETNPNILKAGGSMRPISREAWEAFEAEKRRAEWDEKHPRCEVCGQFLKKRAVPTQGMPFLQFLDYETKGQWVSHYVQDYWGEWDHI